MVVIIEACLVLRSRHHPDSPKGLQRCKLVDQVVRQEREWLAKAPSLAIGGTGRKDRLDQPRQTVARSSEL